MQSNCQVTRSYISPTCNFRNFCNLSNLTVTVLVTSPQRVTFSNMALQADLSMHSYSGYSSYTFQESNGR